MFAAEIMFYVCVMMLASRSVIQVWERGSLFSAFREAVRSRALAQSQDNGSVAALLDAAPPTQVLEGTFAQRLVGKLPRFFVDLFNCPFCLSYHVPLWLNILFYGPSDILRKNGHTFLSDLFLAPIFLLSITALVNLIEPKKAY